MSSSSFSVLVNGTPHGYFSGSRGIRQGDPLSPALFTVFFDLLSRIITKSEEAGRIHGVKVSKTSPPISHLMYADDLTIYCKATASEAREVSRCLTTFSEWSGQVINLSKSFVHFSRNVGQFVKNEVLNILGMVECSHNSKYLGLPFCRYKTKTTMFKDIIGSVETKLAGWKSKVLSYAGRSVLIQSTLQSLPTYAMQTYSLLVGTYKKIDACIRDFWWGFKRDKQRHLYLKAWESFCAPKLNGGLGFRKLKDVNDAFNTKLAWQLCISSEKLWVAVMSTKYLKGLEYLDCTQQQKRGSWIWNCILDSRDLIRKGACFWIVPHSKVRIKKDPWLPALSNFMIPHGCSIPENLYYVRDLMTHTGRSWNTDLLYRIFTREVARSIEAIQILDSPERDVLFWIPSKSGDFSTRSAYRINQREQFTSNSHISSENWKRLWLSTLHNRHKLLLWRLLSQILPSRERLAGIIPDIDTTCPLCELKVESYHHMLLECPFIMALWWNSRWHIRTNAFNHLTFED